MKLVIATTGASGSIYLQRLLDGLRPAEHEIHLVFSGPARQVIATELGALLVRYPAAGALTLTLVLSIFFLVGGGMRTLSALMIDLPNGGWAVLSGIVDVVLGIFLLTSWPVSGLWFLGLAVGIGLIFRGAWWAAFALAVRKLPDQTGKPV